MLFAQTGHLQEVPDFFVACTHFQDLFNMEIKTKTNRSPSIKHKSKTPKQIS